MPSGRIEREAADALFQRSSAEVEADPDNWLRSYRLARAYDYAGDRSRARETMRKAVELEERTMSRTLLVVHHTPVAGDPRCSRRCSQGARDPDIEGVDVRCARRSPPRCPTCSTPTATCSARPRTSATCPGRSSTSSTRSTTRASTHVAGRPYGLWVHGNNDTVGAAAAVEKLATGLALAKVADVLEVAGPVDSGVRERAYELGGTLAATLMN